MKEYIKQRANFVLRTTTAYLPGSCELALGDFRVKCHALYTREESHKPVHVSFIYSISHPEE